MNNGMQRERREAWKERIAQQEKSGVSVRTFCKQLGLKEHAFYGWRQRLRTQQPVAFALVETVEAKPVVERAIIELVLSQGDRLRIPNDEATLRTVLGVLRERS